MERQLRLQLTALIPRLRRFATGLAGTNAEDADDLVQAACERALSRLHQWKPGTRFDSWMFRIVQTVWFNEFALRKRRPQVDTEALDRAVGNDGLREAEARLTLAAVQRAFTQLPDEQRAVMLIVCVEGYTYREAAEILGIPIGTVMSRLARGRLALFETLQDPAMKRSENIIPFS